MRKYLTLLSLLYFSFNQPLTAQVYESAGPYGADGYQLAQDLSGNLYLSTGLSGFFKSTDTGNTWREINNGVLPQSAFTIAASGDTVYGGTFGNGVYRTTTGGASWTPFNTGLPAEADVYTLYADGTGNIYAGLSGQGIYLRATGATGWQNITNDLPSGFSAGSFKTVRSIFKDADTLYIGAEGGATGDNRRIFKSTNNGTNWTDFTFNNTSSAVSVRAWARTGDTLWAGNFTGGSLGRVFRIRRGETAWTADSAGVGLRAVNGLYAAPNGTLYAAVGTSTALPSGGLLTKAAGAPAWSEVNTGIEGRLTRAIFPLSGGGALVTGTLIGVAKTVDFTTFTVSNTGINGLNINAVRAAGNTLYAAAGGNISTAGVASQSGGGVYSSTDNGATWLRDTLGFGPGIPECYEFAVIGSTVYVACSGRAVYKKTGGVWSPANTGIAARTALSVLAFGDTLIAGLSSGTPASLYRSTNGGTSWSSATTAPSATADVDALAQDAAGNLYAGISSSTTVARGVYKSTNGSASWSQSTGAMTVLNNDIYAIAYNPFNATVYAAPNVSSAYTSSDAGATWVSDSLGLENASVDDFLVPQNIPAAQQGTVIAACLGQGTEGGVFVRPPGSSAWQRAGLNLYSAKSLLEKDGTLYVSTGHNSIYKTPLALFPLPVEFFSFSASLSGNRVNLNWTTASEINNAGFDIERAAAEFTVWEKIGFVSGNGTTTEQKSYSFTDNSPFSGKRKYRLKQTDFDGKFAYSPEVEVQVGVPATFRLGQNYPNPFNPATVIKYDLGTATDVSLKVFDVLGREVAALVGERQAAGTYTVRFNATGLASGVYFYKLQAGSFRETKRMMLIK